MDKYEFIYIYKYNEEKHRFILSEIEGAKNGIFITGEDKDKDYLEKYCIATKKTEIAYHLTADITSRKKGFILKEEIDVEDNRSYENIKLSVFI